MPETSLTSEQVLTILAENPLHITAVTSGLQPAQLQTRPQSAQSDTWSATDVLAHLRACADVWGNCIAVIIAQDTPTIRAVNPTTWITTIDYRDQAFESSFRAFAAQRSDLLAILAPLAPNEWARTATVTGAGKPLVRTVHSYAQWLARHERTHLKQFERIVNTLRG